MANPLALVFTFLFCALMSVTSRAQLLQAEVIGEFPYVYAQPDFDAPVISNLKVGAKIQVSKQVYVYNFHKIQLPKGVGYVSSAEIKFLAIKPSPIEPKPTSQSPMKKKDFDEDFDAAMADKTPKNSKPISAARYQGLIFEMQNYVEDTMARSWSNNLLFVGYRIVGNNTMFSGQMSTDLCILFHQGAPTYYEQVTGYPVTGNIFNTHFTFDTIVPVSHNVMASYGFGPMLRYSHYEVNLKNAAGVGLDYFALDDMTLGVLLRVGGAIRLGSFSLRADGKYFIEAKQYASVNLSTLFEF